MDYLNYLRSFDYGTQNFNFIPNTIETNANMKQPVAWPLDFQNKSSQYLLSKAIAGIKSSVSDEKHDELFYDFLISKAPTEEQKNIIVSIRDDEKIHNNIFRKIFTELSGVVMPVNVEEVSMSDNYQNVDYLNGLKEALMGELSAIKKYREIAAYMPSMELYNMVMFPLTDEIRHANLYNYLIALNLNS